MKKDICKLEDVIVERDKNIRMRTHLFWMYLQVNGEEKITEARVTYERSPGLEWTEEELQVVSAAFKQDAWFAGLRMARDIPDPVQEEV